MNKSLPVSPVILLVDDNPHNLQVLGKLLYDENYMIEFAVNGEATLEWLKKRRFDLILLDLNMPGMNGFEVCKRIRSDIKMNNLPVIFLSAESERESILKGFEAGAQDYVTKPFDNRELLARVKTQLDLKSKTENLEKINEWLGKKIDNWLKLSLTKQEKTDGSDLSAKIMEFDKNQGLLLKDIYLELDTALKEMEKLIGKSKHPDIMNQAQEIIRRMSDIANKLKML
jgi:DNA-binding response OmpR family regulator